MNSPCLMCSSATIYIYINLEQRLAYEFIMPDVFISSFEVVTLSSLFFFYKCNSLFVFNNMQMRYI